MTPFRSLRKTIPSDKTPCEKAGFRFSGRFRINRNGPIHLINRTHRAHRNRAFGALAILAALQALAWLSGCESVNVGSPGTDTTQVTGDSAVIRVTNSIAQDPDSLTMLLFSGTTVDWTNANPVKRLGGVPEGGTASFKVPAGTWKLAYEKGAGILVPMQDVESGSGEWLKAIFVKNLTYALILKTDVNETVWVPTFETDPPLE